MKLALNLLFFFTAYLYIGCGDSDSHRDWQARSETQSAARMIANWIEQQIESERVIPDSSEALLQAFVDTQGEIGLNEVHEYADSWGTDFQIVYGNRFPTEVRSAGPDRMFDTGTGGDDIVIGIME